ncbi:MAG: AAA family ATPase [Myxococcales bacterium]
MADAPTPTNQATAASTPPAFVRELDVLIRARYPLLYLVTWEEQRLDAILAELAQAHGKSLYSWSITKGLRKIGGRATAPLENTKGPGEALFAVEKLSEPSLVVLKDFHAYLDDPGVVRALRELAHHLKSTYTTAIILSPTLSIPPELEKEVTVLDVPLPTFRDLYQLLRDIVAVVRQGNSATVDLRKDQAEQLIKAALGLTLSEAENAFAKAIATDGRLDAADVQLVLEEKRQVIRKNGLLEYYPTDESLRDIGGLENLKTWLSRRANAFGEPARKFGLPEPKGVLLLGVQGCGKSLTAKAIASQWHLPLLRLDMGRIFSGLIGSSEENLRKAIRVAESVAPVVLWTDEIEKGMSGIGSSGNSDGGVTARVFGTFLTWLQEKTAPVFVVATANKIENLPPEAHPQGALRRDLLRRSALGRRAQGDPRHPPQEAKARPGEVSDDGAGEARGVVLRRGARAGGHQRPVRRVRRGDCSSSTSTSGRPSPRPSRWPRPWPTRSTSCAIGRAPALDRHRSRAPSRRSRAWRPTTGSRASRTSSGDARRKRPASRPPTPDASARSRRRPRPRRDPLPPLPLGWRPSASRPRRRPDRPCPRPWRTCAACPRRPRASSSPSCAPAISPSCAARRATATTTRWRPPAPPAAPT